MRKIFFAAVVFGTMISCQPKSGTLVCSDQSIKMDTCGVKVDMVYPLVSNQNEEVAMEINEEIIDFLKFGILADDSTKDTDDYTLEEALDTMISRKCSDSVIAHIPYEIISTGSACEYEGMLSVNLDRYLYMGGANGINSIVFLNFDVKTGEKLDVEDIFKDMNALRKIFVSAFMKEKGLKEGQSAEEAGLFIPVDSLPLPSNIGFVKKGVQFVYNQYEIAPRSYGATRITLPYGDIIGLLKKRE